MWIGSRVMSTPAKSLPMLTISRSASSVRLRGTTVTSRKMPSPLGPQPRPSLISVCSARETTSREATGAVAIVVDEQRRREPLLVAVDALVVLHELLVEDVEDRLARDVGHV